MPYITAEQVLEVNDALEEQNITGLTPGQLNYLITQMLVGWLGESPNYTRYNAAMGVMECAKAELYRRRVAPYEDKKIQENGDVYTG